MKCAVRAGRPRGRSGGATRDRLRQSRFHAAESRLHDSVFLDQGRAALQGRHRKGVWEECEEELRADFQHLRRWRKSVEQAQSFTFKAMITIIVTGFVGAVWLGVKVMLGK
jgi:hypothetical protein